MIKYIVFDKQTKEDITDKYTWVITPNGKLYFVDYDSLTGYPDAEVYYMLGEKIMDIWDAEKVFEQMKEKSWVSYSSPNHCRLMWLNDAIKIVKDAIK